MDRVSRVKNEASLEDLNKLLRANVSKLAEADYMTTDVEDIVKNYSGFILDLLKATPRANKVLLCKACTIVFSSSKQVSECFVAAIGRAISFCRDRVKSSTSGKKLHPSVFSIENFLKGEEETGTTRRATSSQSISLTSSSKRKRPTSPAKGSKSVEVLDSPSPKRFQGGFLERTKQMLALSPQSTSRASIFCPLWSRLVKNWTWQPSEALHCTIFY